MNKLFCINPKVRKEQKEIGKHGVEADFVRAVAKLGWKALKFTSEMNRGVSDRIVLKPGAVWFVEIKRGTGVLTALQGAFALHCKQFGLNHFVVYGKEGIKQFIEEASRSEKI